MSKDKQSFEEAGQQDRASIVAELLYFLKDYKKWWLLPILLMIGLVGVLVVLGGTGAAPFIYALF